VIDEAHLLHHAQLESIRMLTNHDMDSPAHSHDMRVIFTNQRLVIVALREGDPRRSDEHGPGLSDPFRWDQYVMDVLPSTTTRHWSTSSPGSCSPLRRDECAASR
jgi:hypothetical protein